MWMPMKVLRKECMISSRRRGLATVMLTLMIGPFGLTNGWGAPCPSVPRPPQTFYVSTSGDNSNLGTTVAKPFQTIQKAVDCLTVAGDKVFIFGGTYTESVKINQKKVNLVSQSS